MDVFLHPSLRAGEASSCRGQYFLLLRIGFQSLAVFIVCINGTAWGTLVGMLVCTGTYCPKAAAVNILQWRKTADNPRRM